MKVGVFSAKPYDRSSLEAANRGAHQFVYFEPHLDEKTAVLAEGCRAVCAFVNDTLDASAIERLARQGVKLIAMRCAGFNNVDVGAAAATGMAVARVPAYSPYAVAEHTAALILALNRRIHRAFNRVREGNFALDGLMGFDLRGRVAGVVGTGKIGAVFAGIMRGFGCRILAHDIVENPECTGAGDRYVPLDRLFRESDIVSLHCPLTPSTRHLIGAGAIAMMKRGVMLINTSRGALIDTRAVIEGLKSGQIGYLGLDVYEEEADLFFEDLSGRVLQDDVFARLTTFPNVLITGHQAFFTEDALRNIAETTVANISTFESEGAPVHAVPRPKA
ncbi:MAG: 2-hydroxyacid dehydrogenase [Bryobacteraceae bacterium]|nr:2-hydroxyacid dehydrogenase [Bryobacteraceae bacterium]